MDAGVKASSQDELTLAVERMLGPTFTLGLKATYRKLVNAFDTRCDFDYSSPETDYSQCAFINPGSSGKFASGNAPTCNGLFEVEEFECSPTGPPSPAARRVYRGIELLARKSVGDRLWLQASYVYSSLRGNFDGAVNEGIYEQPQGNTQPGVEFGLRLSGALAQRGRSSDARPPASLPVRRLLDDAGPPDDRSAGLRRVRSAAQPARLLNANYGSAIFLVPRGSAGRLPWLWDANLTLSYPIELGPVTATLQAYVFHLFDNQIATSRDQRWSTSLPLGYPATIYDPSQEQNNPNYGKVTSRSEARFFRAAVRVAF